MTANENDCHLLTLLLVYCEILQQACLCEIAYKTPLNLIKPMVIRLLWRKLATSTSFCSTPFG